MSWRIADLNCTACGCRLKDEMFKASAMPNCPECGAEMEEGMASPGLGGFDKLGRS